MRIRPGGWAWIGLAAYIVVADSWLIRRKRETMSVVFGDALRHPAKRMPVVVAWLIITLHLFAVFIPEGVRRRVSRLDPIGAAARLIEKTAPGG